jgi:hypothetical protein
MGLFLGLHSSKIDLGQPFGLLNVLLMYGG